jgi:phosphoadenosine phosphosulfate reductase
MNEELQRKVDRAVKLIKAAGEIAAEHGQPLEVCYSGGKDSDVILELTKMADVNYRAIYKNTTIDPPGTIKHAKDNGVEIMQPTMTFKQVIEESGLPSRYRRTCCNKLKEYKVLDYAVVGIRRDESAKRAERYKEPEICRVYNKHEKARQYLPILEFTAADIEEFIKERGIKCHPLYYDPEGNFHVERRLGCIGCPLASKKHRIEQFRKYPKMVRYYINAAQTFLDTHPQSKINGYFRDAYQWFAFTLTSDTLEEFNGKFSDHNLFGEGIDCKEYLEKILNTTL